MELRTCIIEDMPGFEFSIPRRQCALLFRAVSMELSCRRVVGNVLSERALYH